MKKIIKNIIVILIILFLSTWVFNHVHAWVGIFSVLGIYFPIINIYNLIQKDEKS